MEDPKRERAAITAAAERHLLVAMAQRLPRGVTSDHLTVLGVLGALGAGAGYALSGLSPHWLWLASIALVVNWFGDSLDGTVARVRRSERPRYGYYLDHAVDAFTTVVIGVGIGLSPYLSLTAGILLVVLYLMMSVNVYLESAVFGVFRMDYGLLGPTEVRILLIAGNTLLIAFDLLAGLTPAAIQPPATMLTGALIAAMAVLLLVRFAGNLRRLAGLEPRRRDAEAGAGTGSADGPADGPTDGADADGAVKADNAGTHPAIEAAAAAGSTTGP
jgi:archaetidylinositol phosphate synthase